MNKDTMAELESVTASPAPTTTRAVPGGASRDEMNLVEFPLAVLSTRVNPDIKTLEFADKQRLPSGEVVERKWIITGADKFGLPTSTDDDVILGLICLSKDQGFRERKVFFTRYELLKILRWTTEGRSYTRLIKSLDRLSGVRIRAANSFFDNSAKAYQTRNFGIIDAYEINDERATSKAPNSYFIWSEAMFNSFQSGYIKKIDLNIYFSLRSAVSRRLYRYLDKHFYYKASIEKPLHVVAYEKLGVSRTQKYVSALKQQIQPACEELVQLGFLSSYEFLGKGEAATIKFMRNIDDYALAKPVVVPTPQHITIATAARHQAASQETPDHELLVQELVKRGLTEYQSKHLARNKNANDVQRIKQILSYYDELVSSADKKVSRNPIGFLYRAVEAPFKFKIPESKAPLIVETVAASRPNRPELKIVNSHAKKSSGEGRGLSSYETFVEQVVNAYKTQLGDEIVRAKYEAVQRKTACLRSAIEKSQYEKAVDGMVNNDLAKELGLPSYDEWSKRVRPLEH